MLFYIVNVNYISMLLLMHQSYVYSSLTTTAVMALDVNASNTTNSMLLILVMVMLTVAEIVQSTKNPDINDRRLLVALILTTI